MSSTLTKPRTRWLGIMSHFRPSEDEISAFVVQLWQMARDIDRAPAWLAWWRPAGFPRLELRPGASEFASWHLTQRGRRLVVDSTWPQLWLAATAYEEQLPPNAEGAQADQEATILRDATTEAVYGSLAIVDDALDLGGLPPRVSHGHLGL